MHGLVRFSSYGSRPRTLFYFLTLSRPSSASQAALDEFTDTSFGVPAVRYVQWLSDGRVLAILGGPTSQLAEFAGGDRYALRDVSECLLLCSGATPPKLWTQGYLYRILH